MAKRTRPPGRPAGPGVDIGQRREELLDAAERAIRQKGPHIGLEEVARQAELARSGVYAIFPSRAALMEALSKRHAARILIRIAEETLPDTTGRQRLSIFIDSLCRWIEEEPELYRILGGHALMGDDETHGLFDEIADITERALVENLSALHGDTSAAGPWSRAMIGSTAAAAAWWRRTATMSRAELVSHLTQMSWEGGAHLPLFGIQSSRTNS